jgi:hypothetical protein
MMITLNIDDQTFSSWRKHASAHGLSVEDWLKNATTCQTSLDDIGDPVAHENSSSERTLRERLESIALRHGSIGSPVDVSRESIYD